MPIRIGAPGTRTEQGSYGLIYIDAQSATALKIFWKNVGDRIHRQMVFQNEVTAYRLAMADPILCDLVPKFYETHQIEQILDQDGTDISAQFELDLAFMMQFVPGEFIKIGSLPYEVSAPTRALFHKAGIRGTTDASVQVRNGQITKVVDFSTDQVELWHKD